MGKFKDLRRLSQAAQRRMGLEVDEDELDAKIAERVEQALADLQAAGKLRGGATIALVSTGLQSSPSPGSKKVVNLFVTPDGKLEIFYDTES